MAGEEAPLSPTQEHILGDIARAETPEDFHGLLHHRIPKAWEERFDAGKAPMCYSLHDDDSLGWLLPMLRAIAGHPSISPALLSPHGTARLFMIRHVWREISDNPSLPFWHVEQSRAWSHVIHAYLRTELNESSRTLIDEAVLGGGEMPLQSLVKASYQVASAHMTRFYPDAPPLPALPLLPLLEGEELDRQKLPYWRRDMTKWAALASRRGDRDEETSMLSINTFFITLLRYGGLHKPITTAFDLDITAAMLVSSGPFIYARLPFYFCFVRALASACGAPMPHHLLHAVEGSLLHGA